MTTFEIQEGLFVVIVIVIVIVILYLPAFEALAVSCSYGGPVGTRTGETFDVFENVVFPL